MISDQPYEHVCFFFFFIIRLWTLFCFVVENFCPKGKIMYEASKQASNNNNNSRFLSVSSSYKTNISLTMEDNQIQFYYHHPNFSLLFSSLSIPVFPQPWNHHHQHIISFLFAFSLFSLRKPLFPYITTSFENIL